MILIGADSNITSVHIQSRIDGFETFFFSMDYFEPDYILVSLAAAVGYDTCDEFSANCPVLRRGNTRQPAFDLPNVRSVAPLVYSIPNTRG